MFIYPMEESFLVFFRERGFIYFFGIIFRVKYYPDIYQLMFGKLVLDNWRKRF